MTPAGWVVEEDPSPAGSEGLLLQAASLSPSLLTVTLCGYRARPIDRPIWSLSVTIRWAGVGSPFVVDCVGAYPYCLSSQGILVTILRGNSHRIFSFAILLRIEVTERTQNSGCPGEDFRDGLDLRVSPVPRRGIFCDSDILALFPITECNLNFESTNSGNSRRPGNVPKVRRRRNSSGELLPGWVVIHPQFGFHERSVTGHATYNSALKSAFRVPAGSFADLSRNVSNYAPGLHDSGWRITRPRWIEA